MKLFSRQKEIIIHIIFWSIFIFSHLVELKPNSDFGVIIDTINPFSISYILINAAVFYLNYLYLLKRFFDVKAMSKFFIGLILIYSFFIFFRYLIEEILFLKIFGTGNYFEGTPLSYYVLDNLYWGSIPIFASSVIWIVINLIRSLQKEVFLTEEKKRAEIQFLKSQINPHFIFNTLNNIYSLVFKKSDQALPAIEKLSEIMRFTTYETQKEKIKIGSEISYIESFIALEKIRNNNPVFFKLQYEIEDKNLLIPPYLLLPFVENCIKHGILDDAKNPVFFSVKSSKNTVIVATENKINNKLKDNQSGIGIENLKKRLAFYFPNNYKLEIISEGNIFKSYLQIQL
ncbi:histidine kinase [Flavobacterium sp. NST-5]|uniref:Histidine kinase n=1 Tax=Flavobacterium ichthyis TaxID=2698827 RepID=A0ABW9ZB57_9FLAO|nr:sensor histidine kinase [Flavobacterium ichthyis]NBL65819.1 histidine kinase [Flavobacterium ichthyis]